MFRNASLKSICGAGFVPTFATGGFSGFGSCSFLFFFLGGLMGSSVGLTTLIFGETFSLTSIKTTTTMLKPRIR